ncbi:MAG: [protein-PII] uridylyltransferase [Gammaproteobacteria bacterium]|nr:[protein-PII] uridylyltransferase [Gammaproteobacteria bacterium]
MRFAKSKLLNPAAVKAALENGEAPIPLFKTAIKNALQQLAQQQLQGISSAELIEKYTWMIDQLVIIAWHQHSRDLPESVAIELVAVGGYGRGELHPYSDVDLLILLQENDYDKAQQYIETYLRFLWDIGLEIGHSMRSIKDCLKEARLDITIMTNLLEARHLAGNDSLLTKLDDKLRNGRIWPPEKFYVGKCMEQESRHAQYQDTAYSLEPNIKDSPGGLRDLQTILWVYNRHFGIRSFREMKEQGHINNDEYRILIRARNMLWKLRSGLHLSNNRHEDRLLFDSQRKLAEDYGYQDTPSHLAVEQLMKRFYRTVKQVIYLNEVLLSHYRVTYNRRFSLASSRTIDNDFQIKNKMIEQRTEDLFARKPRTMLKLFVLMEEHKVTGIHPDTIRAIRANLGKINNEFRADPKCKELFLQLFKSQGTGLANVLARMNAYGVLGAYLPTFGAIVGQMQHDLFHVYTVDGHTLMVIEKLINLREHPDEFPIATSIFKGLYRPERLFIGALFHDIAKGRGGDHSILGEADAYKFCIAHGMSEFDAKLVGWLVVNHLRMSHFSQRRDISDPKVVAEFAALMGDIERLDNLYLLTLADIRGTSPKVWNAWKGQLLLELYKATSKALRQGLATPVNEAEHVEDDKNAALKKLSRQLSEELLDESLIQQFWDTLPNDYFIRNEPYYIAWHAASLCRSMAIGSPIVSVRYSERLEANMFFIFAPDSNQLLSKVTASFDALDISIIEAQMQMSNNGFALYSFKANVDDGESGEASDYMRFLENQLRRLILSDKNSKAIRRRKASRALKHFPIKPRVSFSFHNPTYTTMEVVAQDQPGLLHNVALILQHHQIKLVGAKVATFGERAEDIFFIQRQDLRPVTDDQILADLENDINTALDRNPQIKALDKTANAR